MAGLETLHIACAILWLGNFVVTGFWSIRAWATRDVALRVFAAREILATDLFFTLIFGAAVTITGIVLAQREGFTPWAMFWTRTALETIGAAGIVWLVVLLPLELRMRSLAAGTSTRLFNRLFLAWNVAGWLVTAALFSVTYLMVEKPT